MRFLTDGHGVGVESAAREIAIVLALALAGLAIAGAVVLAPWHPAAAAVVIEVHPPRDKG